MCLDDDCGTNGLDRRTFVAGSAAAFVGASGFSPLGSKADQERWPTRVLDDPAVQHEKVIFKHDGKDTFDGFLARPKKPGIFPAVLVVAGNRITEEYIPNTCAALALAGFVGLAPNVFHPLPERATTRDEMNALLQNHTNLDVLLDVQAGADYLRTQPFVKPGGMGVLGFCFGGRIALLHGARSREIDAVVPFHPGPVTAEEIDRLKSPVQVHSGTADKQVPVASIKALEAILERKGSGVEVFWYEGADHGFLAYTRPTYKADAAQQAWRRTVEFLRKHLPGLGLGVRG